MKTLLQTTVWAPLDQPKRLETLRKHLLAIPTYKGKFDLLINVNGSELNPIVDPIIKEMGDITGAEIEAVTVARTTDNKGWCWARNNGIKTALEGDYDLLILMDCDIWVEKLDWILKAQDAAKIQPAFMCRMFEAKCMKGGARSVFNYKWEMYDEWLGCINVLTRKAMETCGGYDNVTFPQEWGYHDCEYGRRLLKAGFFKLTGEYPSLSGLRVIEEHDREYDTSMQSMKDTYGQKYSGTFWAEHTKGMSGEKPLFFDYNIGQ